MNDKSAQNIYPVHDLIKQRWSPRAFSEKEISIESIRNIFEAARWAPSAFNEQPWSFILGFRGDHTYETIFNSLVEFNRLWVKPAPLLIVSCGCKVLTGKNEINATYQYDTGQSVACLTIQAMHEGVYVHQMGGFEPSKLIHDLEIPAKYKPITVMALGYPGNPDSLPERMRKSETSVRNRKAFDTFVFSEKFGKKTALFE